VRGEELDLRGTADHGDRLRAEAGEDCERLEPDAARRRLHEHDAALADRAESHEAVPGGQRLHRERGPRLEGPAGRERGEVARVGVDRRRVAAEAGEHDDPVPHRRRRSAGERRAERLDDAGGLEAGYETAARGRRIEPETGEGVREIEADGVYRDARLAGARWIERLLDQPQAPERTCAIDAPCGAVALHGIIVTA
jgi:hypothetical protein